jgi:hypothetical protein
MATVNQQQQQQQQQRRRRRLTGREIIDRLRNEAFNVETEQRLENHPYVKAAEAGTLRMAQKRAFCREQYAIQRSDAISFAHLAGHRGFRPKSLTGVEVPSSKAARPDDDDDDDVSDLFQFLLGGEVVAAPMLLRYAAHLGIDSESKLRNNTSSSSLSLLSPLAQAYPSYWARMALDGSRAAGAAACAVNFPAWGRMCARLYHAEEEETSKGGGGGGEDTQQQQHHLDFIKFFATPIENLDQMAAAIIDKEDWCNDDDDDDDEAAIIIIDDYYEEIKEHVRLLQEYEVLFWDAIYEAKDDLIN